MPQTSSTVDHAIWLTRPSHPRDRRPTGAPRARRPRSRRRGRRTARRSPARAGPRASARGDRSSVGRARRQPGLGGSVPPRPPSARTGTAPAAAEQRDDDHAEQHVEHEADDEQRRAGSPSRPLRSTTLFVMEPKMPIGEKLPALAPLTIIRAHEHGVDARGASAKPMPTGAIIATVAGRPRPRPSARP